VFEFPVFLTLGFFKLRRLIALLLLLLLGSIAVTGVSGVAPSNAASANVSVQIVRILSGLVGYARWPAAPEKYRFCSAGYQRYLRDVQEHLKQVDGRYLIFREIGNESEWMASCDILYLGVMSPSARTELLAKAIKYPILTISEDDPVCADATMFCLAMQGGEVSLLANLDTISRSAIRINTKVLQLFQRKRTQP